MDLKTFEMLLSTRRKRRPFRPFVVELDNGSEVEVHHPESLIVQKGTVGRGEDLEEIAVAYYIRTFDEGVHIFESSAVTQIRDSRVEATA